MVNVLRDITILPEGSQWRDILEKTIKAVPGGNKVQLKAGWYDLSQDQVDFLNSCHLYERVSFMQVFLLGQAPSYLTVPSVSLYCVAACIEFLGMSPADGINVDDQATARKHLEGAGTLKTAGAALSAAAVGMSLGRRVEPILALMVMTSHCSGDEVINNERAKFLADMLTKPSGLSGRIFNSRFAQSSGVVSYDNSRTGILKLILQTMLEQFKGQYPEDKFPNISRVVAVNEGYICPSFQSNAQHVAESIAHNCRGNVDAILSVLELIEQKISSPVASYRQSEFSMGLMSGAAVGKAGHDGDAPGVGPSPHNPN